MAKLLELLAEAGSALADTLLSAVFKAKDGRTAAAGTDVSAVANPGRQDCCRSASPAGGPHMCRGTRCVRAPVSHWDVLTCPDNA